MKYCIQCGSPVSDEAKFCNNCGANIGGEKNDANRKKTAIWPWIVSAVSVVAIVVCLLIVKPWSHSELDDQQQADRNDALQNDGEDDKQTSTDAEPDNTSPDAPTLDVPGSSEEPDIPDEPVVSILEEGQIGDDVVWKVTEDRVMTISGSGAVNDEFGTLGEIAEKYGIERLIVEDGVTDISDLNLSGNETLKYVELSGTAETQDYPYDLGTSFSDCKVLNEVVLHDGIKVITLSMFEGCESLTSIVLPSSLEYIGSLAFRNSGLTEIEIPCSVSSVGSAVFSHCMNLKDIYVEQGNATYFSQDGVLYYRGVDPLNIYQNSNSCTYLVSYPAGRSGTAAIPDGVTGILNAAFSGCKDLEQIMLGNVSVIDEYAFEYCSKIETITVPDDLISISGSAFLGCSKLHSIEVEGFGVGMFYSDGGALYGYTYEQDETEPTGAIPTLFCVPPAVVTDGGTFGIQMGTEAIATYAFYGCGNLEAVYIPGTMKIIREMAFYGCDSLETIFYAGPTYDAWNSIKIEGRDWGTNKELTESEIILCE